MRILDLIRGEKLPSSAELREAITKAEGAGKDAVERMEQLTRQRADALLDEDNKALDRIEKDLTTATRDADRMDLAVAELTRRLGEAVAAERQAELDALYERGMAAHHQGVAVLRKEYPKLAKKLAEIAETLERLDHDVEAVNKQLRASGDARQVPTADETVRPSPAALPFYRGKPVWCEMVLPSLVETDRSFYPGGAPLNPGEVGKIERSNWP